MNKILEYVLANYTWILGVIIIILLAVIGSYADKTNFGQGKLKKQEDKENDQNDLAENQPNKPEANIETVKKTEQVKQTKQNIVEKEEKEIEDSKKIIAEAERVDDKKFDDEFEEMSQEVDEFLPKKELIDGELLDEIENLSLDKTQKINTSDIPDLDDVELPEIKSFKSTDDDIWKF